MKPEFKDAAVLILVVIISASILSLVNAFTAPIIAENKDKNRLSMANDIFPEADEMIGKEVYRNGERIGFLQEGSRYGYSSELKVLVGIDTKGIIKGVRILEQQETPGLGARIVESDFTDQFIGKSGQISLGSDIDGITGATKSSSAAVDAVNLAIGFDAVTSATFISEYDGVTAATKEGYDDDEDEEDEHDEKDEEDEHDDEDDEEDEEDEHED